MPSMRTYTGSCHCGRVRFEATTDLARVGDCNCSFCHRRGALLSMVPDEHFTLLAGEDALCEYRFGAKIRGHFFCTECGVAPFSRATTPDGRSFHGVNVRCLADVDLATLIVTPVDGRAY